MKKSIFKIGLLTLAAVFLLSGCSFSFPWEKDHSVSLEQEQNQEEIEVEIQETKSSGDLRKFASEDSLKNFLANASSGGLSASWLLADKDYGQADIGLTEVAASAGVSGADILKASEGYIYAIVRNEIIIINAVSAAEAKIESRIKFSSRPLEMIVAGSRLAVFGNDQDIKSSSIYKTFSSRGDYSFFKVFDISDATQPREVRSLSFEGGYAGVFLSGNYAYFLTAQAAAYRSGEPIIPRIIENEKVISSFCGSEKNCATSAVYYFDAPYNNYTFLSMNVINIASRDEAINSQIYLIDPTYSFHLSVAGNFYLARYQALSAYDLEQEIKLDLLFDRLSQADQSAINEIKQSPESLLNSSEKRAKSAVIIEKQILLLNDEDKENLKKEVSTLFDAQIKKRSKDLEKSAVYKFSLKSGKIDYQARGEVLGRIVGPSAWNEKDGSLRVVTSRNDLWSTMLGDTSKHYSNVYVLDSGLRVLGSLENIAAESVLSFLSFFGDRVYMFMAKSDAPVYVLDLSEPSKPVVLGAVIMTGNSPIYQLDDKGEIVLGFSHRLDITSAQSDFPGFKVSVFDFSDLKNPKEISSYAVATGDGDSVAFRDYKSVLTYLKQGKMLIPASLRNAGVVTFAGALAFNIDKNGVLGTAVKLDHSAEGKFNQLDYWRDVQYYDNSVKRSLVVGDNLVTFSNKYLKINRLSDFSEVSSLTLTPDEKQVESAVILSAETSVEDESISEGIVDMIIDETGLPVDGVSATETPVEIPTETGTSTEASSN